MACGQLRTRADKNDQHDEKIINDVPEGLPEPPPPPDKTVRQLNRHLSIELEGERKTSASCKDELTRAEMDAPGVSGCDKDPKKPTKEAYKCVKMSAQTVGAKD